MKVVNFGALNVDHVYNVPHFVQPGETLSSLEYTVTFGGKGLNQSVALALAGAEVLHAGFIGAGGEGILLVLEQAGVDTEHLQSTETAAGHAIIQVDKAGQNSIIIHGGSNHSYTQEYIQKIFKVCQPGDIVLFQNETNGIEFIAKEAKRLGLRIAFNPSPMTPALAQEFPYEIVDYLFINEIEGKAMTGKGEPAEILEQLGESYPEMMCILTLGNKGGIYQYQGERIEFPIYPITVVDTTGAGDTFTGYCLANLLKGAEPKEALYKATVASGLAVSRLGASNAIPKEKEVEEHYRKFITQL